MKKLQLNKETLRILNDDYLPFVRGDNGGFVPKPFLGIAARRVSDTGEGGCPGISGTPFLVGAEELNQAILDQGYRYKRGFSCPQTG